MSLGLAATLASAALPAGAQTTGTVVKKGTEIGGTLQQALSSKTSHNGDPFTLAEKDTFWHKVPAALKGGVIEGHLEGVTPASATHKATMSIIFDDIRMPGGQVLPIHAKLVSFTVFEAKTHHIRDAGIIIGTAVVGHMAASKAGVQHGGLAGAAAGFALVSTMKSDIVVNPGTLVKLKLLDDLTASAFTDKTSST
jgi:hypothetical protein